MKRKILLAAVLLFVAIQVWQPDRTNPPVDPALAFAATAAAPAPATSVVERACGDCHSNRTAWPWYSRVAPVSWLVAHDVAEAREHMNLSEWGRLSQEKSRDLVQEMCEEVRDGAMPPWYYSMMHPEARLSDADVAALCAASGEGVSSRLHAGRR